MNFSDGTVFLTGMISGLTEGLHALCIHQLGDTSMGAESTGPIRFELHEFVANSKGSIEFEVNVANLDLSAEMGRAIVLHGRGANPSKCLAVGVISRAEGCAW
jgi:Cu/Zn superoxide dismutase